LGRYAAALLRSFTRRRGVAAERNNRKTHPHPALVAAQKTCVVVLKTYTGKGERSLIFSPDKLLQAISQSCERSPRTLKVMNKNLSNSNHLSIGKNVRVAHLLPHLFVGSNGQ
jgi:hypothetical protein